MAHDTDGFEREFAQSIESHFSSQLADGEAETTGVEAIATTPADSIYVFGKLPSSSGFVRAGNRGAAEGLFEAWMHHTMQCANGVLPARSVRFVAAPDATPMIGVWVPSCDGDRSVFPLVLLRRLPSYASDIPWTLLLHAYRPYLDAVESRLVPGAYDGVDRLYAAANAYPLPDPSTFASEAQEAGIALGRERVHTFAARNALAYATPESTASCEESVRDLSAEPIGHHEEGARYEHLTRNPPRAQHTARQSAELSHPQLERVELASKVSSREYERARSLARGASAPGSASLIDLLTAARGSKRWPPSSEVDSRALAPNYANCSRSAHPAGPASDDDTAPRQWSANVASSAPLSSHEPVALALDWMCRVLVGLKRLCEHPAPYPTLELRAQRDFDLYVWLELLRALLGPSDRPRALFWCPRDGRVLIDLGAPSTATLRHLGRSRDRRTPDAMRSGQEPVIDLRSVRQRGVEYGEFGTGLVADGGEAGVTAGDIRRELDARARSLIDRNAAVNELVGALAVSR
jgi:hypothetical protein